MTELAETNTLLKKAIKNTYKKSIASKIHPIRRLLTLQELPRKKTKVKFADKSNKESKDSNNTCKNKTVKANNNKNTTSNTVSEIQTSH